MQITDNFDLQPYDVGVIIGRFQVPELHSSHKKLFDTVSRNHQKIICVIGLSPLKTTVLNPLDFQQRDKMIRETYPDVICVYIKDINSDELWSKRIDELVMDHLMPGQKPLLYGSRDSFISHYTGGLDTFRLESDSFISGKEIRKDITRASYSSKDFRMGVCWASANRFPVSYTTVDILIFDEDRRKILLGRKADEKKFRIIGGFSDPNSESLEDDAKREVAEETDVEVSNLKYHFSMRINDWRYKNEVDKIKTTVWSCKYLFGRPEGGDDIAVVKWFEVKDLKNSRFLQENIVEGHIKIFNKFFNIKASSNAVKVTVR